MQHQNQPAPAFLRIWHLCSTKGRSAQTRTYTGKDGQPRTYQTGQQGPRDGLLGIGETTLREWIREGRFPAPLKLGGRVSVWRAEDVYAWIEQQAGQGDKQ